MTKLVSIIMGSKSDLPIMQNTLDKLQEFEIPYEVRCISAHRAPHLLVEYVSGLKDKGIEVIIAGAGCAAHLPGVVAGLTHLPVLGVPIDASPLNGLDALLSIVQMPGGVPVATFAVGKAGAVNAAVFAASILANKYPNIQQNLSDFRNKQSQNVLALHDSFESMVES